MGSKEILVTIRPGTLKPFTEWTSPTGDEIKAALKMINKPEIIIASMLGLNKEAKTLRRWKTGENTIPYTAWCIICYEANLGIIWK